MKKKRFLHFKPSCRQFAPVDCRSTTTLQLLHEEIEALYLSDVLGLYQSEAAEKMGVSRPTFANILRSARQKVGTMLVSGAALEIEDAKDDAVVVIATDDTQTHAVGKANASYLIRLHMRNGVLTERKTFHNPVVDKQRRPGQVLPSLFAQWGVNFFIVSEVGAGLKQALLSMGIQTVIQKRWSLDAMHTDTLMQHIMKKEFR